MKKCFSKKIAKGILPILATSLIFGSFLAGCSDTDDEDSSSTEQKTETESPKTDNPSQADGQGKAESAVSVAVYPENGAAGVFEDSRFYLTFDEEPSFGEEVLAVICDAETDEYVDFLSQEESEDMISDGTQVATFNTNAGKKEGISLKRYYVQKDGKQIVIIPHSDTLKAGKSYYILIDDGSFIGKISGKDFHGFAKNEWKFTVRDAYTPPRTDNKIKVAQTGDADYRTVQGALKAAEDGDTIIVEPGCYKEIVWYKQKKNITIIGNGSAEYGRDVVIQGWNGNCYNPSTAGRAAFYFGGGSLTLKNITIQNPYDRNVDGTAQSEALHYQGGKELVAYNCSFLGYQDTLLTNGKNWFYKCYVEGDTDFMWGTADVALFEECSIKQLDTSADKKPASASYLFETRIGSVSSETVPKGYVLLNCKVESAHPKSYFARRATPKSTPTTYYDQAAIINCTFTGTPNAELWSGVNCSGNEPEFVAKDANGNMHVGWKTYGGSGYPTEKVNAYAYFGTITKEVYEAEYSGRNVIFNKVYNKAENAYEVNNTKFDTAKYENALGFTATADTSELSGEEAVPGANGTYNFVNGEDGTFTTSDGNITVTTSQKNNGTHGVTTEAGATIAVKVAGMAKITIYGCQYMAGKDVTISDQSGKELGKIVTKVPVDGQGVDFVYTGSEPNVITFTFSANECIHGIAVKPIKEVVKVKGITVNSNKDELTVGEDPLELTATVSPSDALIKEVVWSSSDVNVATVDENGKVTPKKSGTVKIKATAKDGNNVFGEKAITVKEDVNVISAEWDFLNDKTTGFPTSDIEANKEYTFDRLTMKFTASNVWKGGNNAYGFGKGQATFTFKAKGNVVISVSNTYQQNHYTVTTTSATAKLSSDKIESVALDLKMPAQTDTVTCFDNSGSEYYITLTSSGTNYPCKVKMATVSTFEANEWDFLGSESMATYKGYAKQGSFTKGGMTVSFGKSSTWANDSSGYSVKYGDNITLTAKGNVEVTLGYTYNGSGYTAVSSAGTITPADTSEVTGKGTHTFTCTGAGDEEYTITLTSKGQNYLSKVGIKAK